MKTVSRKDYKLIASIIKHYSDNSLVKNLALDLCSSFLRDNPRFSTRKFLEACGISVPGSGESSDPIVRGIVKNLYG